MGSLKIIFLLLIQFIRLEDKQNVNFVYPDLNCTPEEISHDILEVKNKEICRK